MMEDKIIPAKVWQLFADYYPNVYEMIEDFCEAYENDEKPL